MEMDVESLVMAAGTALGERLQFVADLSFSNRARVARLSTTGGTSVIAKWHAKPEWHARELMALQLLGGGVAPELLAASSDVVVMEDLGDGTSLADLLLGSDQDAAERGLLAWARAIGGVASATVGRSGGEPLALDARFDVDAFRELAVTWKITPSNNLVDELDSARRRLNHVAPADLSLVAFDSCPDNTRVTDDRARLFDFESSGWGNSAFDAAYCTAPFCTCWCLARLPAKVRARMFAAYVSAHPLASGDDFSEQSTFAGIFLVLWSMRRSSSWAVDNPMLPPADRSVLNARQHLLLRAEWMSEQSHCAPATARFGKDLVSAILARFPATTVPDYPAFSSSN